MGNQHKPFDCRDAAGLFLSSWHLAGNVFFMQAGRSKGSRTAWGHMPLAVLSHAGKYLHIYFSAAGRQLAEPAGGRAPFRYSRSRRDYAEACTLNLKDRCRCTVACSSASRAFGLQGFVQIALKFGRRSRFSRNVGLWDLSLR